MALEIRIHGVANTSPKSMLQEYGQPTTEVELADGDEKSGFWRRSDEPENAQFRRLAYSWGRLTAGAPSGKDIARGLWAALLPFALANAALWAVEPEPVGAAPSPPETSAEPVATNQFRHYLVRVLCLLLTATFALAITGVVVDESVWQCGTGCAHKLPGQDQVIAGWFANGLRPLGVGLVVVALAMVGIFRIARRSYQYEAFTTHRDADTPPRAHPFASTVFWTGTGQVTALARVHLAVGLAVPSAVTAGAVRALRHDAGHAPGTEAVAWVALGFAAAAGLLVLWTVLTAAVTTRTGADPPGWTWLPLACALVALGLTIAAVVPGFAGMGPTAVHHSALPGFSGVVAGSFSAQLVLLFVLGATSAGRTLARILIPLLVLVTVALIIAKHLHQSDASVLGWAAAVAIAAAAAALLIGDAHGPSAWHGQAPAVFAGAGVVVASLYSAAALFWTANWLNGHPPVTSPRSSVHVPTALLWSGAGLLLAVVPLGVIAVNGLRRYRAHAEARNQPVRTDYPNDDDLPPERYAERVEEIAKARALHDLIGTDAFPLVGTLGVIAFGMCAEGALVTLLGYSPTGPHRLLRSGSHLAAVLNWITNVGSSLAGVLAIGLATLLLLAYRDAGPIRKMLGVLWDIATFWPRAAHPFMPPCYAERIVPQLLDKINGQEPDEPIVFSAHSQGSVIGVAMLMQLPTERLERMYYLTYGTQLTKIFGPVFPRYLGQRAKNQLAELLGAPAGARWASLWRPTDYLGWELEVESVTNTEVRDPATLGPPKGDVSPAPIHKHSDYWLSAEYVTARNAGLFALRS